MPIDFNENRTECFPTSDVAVSHHFERAGRSTRNIITVNDAIEVHQYKMITEAYINYLDANSTALGKSVERFLALHTKWF